MLTRKDIDIIDELMEEKFNEKLKGLPSKDEFYEKMDDVMGELKAIREEQTVSSQHLSEHSDTLENHELRLSKLEKKSPATAIV